MEKGKRVGVIPENFALANVDGRGSVARLGIDALIRRKEEEPRGSDGCRDRRSQTTQSVPRGEKGLTEGIEWALDVMAAGAATAPRVEIARDW